MFSQVCVILFTGGVYLSMHVGGCVWCVPACTWAGSVSQHAPGQTGGVCLVGLSTCRGVCVGSIYLWGVI